MRGPIVGALLVVAVALAIGLEASTFEVAFPTDPLGPKAFPMVAALLMMVGGLALVRGGGMTWSRRDGEGGGVRVLVASASFVGYAFLLAPLGFVLATALEFAVLTRVFGGPVVRGGAAGLAFGAVLYVLFVYGLGLPLPLGLFARG